MAGNLDKNYDIYDLGLDKNLMRNDSLVLPNSVSQNQSSDNFYGDKFSGGLFDPLDGTYDPQSMRSGELPSLIGYAKKRFTDSIVGLLMGIDIDKTYKWIIGGTIGGVTSSMDWNVTKTNTLTINGNLDVTGGTITGGTFQTRATGRRMVITSADNNLHIYDSGNREVGTLGISGTNATLLNINSPSASPFSPIVILQNGEFSQASIFIQNEDFGTGSVGMQILQKGDKSALFLRNDTTSTGNVLDIEHSRTTGGVTEVVKIQNFSTGSYTLNIIDNNSTSSTVYLNKKTLSGAGIYIDCTNLNTTGYGLYSNMQGQGYAIFAYSSNANTTQSTVFLGSSGKNVVLDIVSNSTLSDLSAVQIYQSSNYYGVAFKKIFSLNTTVIWRSNGTNPDGVLSGTVGDICVNGDNNKPAYCTGGTNWTNLV